MIDILFLTSGRNSCFNILRKLIHISSINIVGVVASKNDLNMREFCLENKLVYYTPLEIYDSIKNTEVNIDYVISYLYPFLIKKELISIAKKEAINFHPAPLPDHKGVAGCCYCIMNEMNEWGVSAHLIDENFDTGGIIKVNRFSFDNRKFTGKSLEIYISKKLEELFYEILEIIQKNAIITCEEQSEGGHYYSKKDLNQDKIISFEDDLDTIRNKIHGLWFPPYMGAYIEIKGEKFSLVDEMVLREISELYNKE